MKKKKGHDFEQEEDWYVGFGGRKEKKEII